MYREKLEAIYLDWRNNYLSIQTFADHNGLTEQQAKELIALARSIAMSEHPDK